jgi:Major tropism determinant N-terminal domain
MAQQVQFRRGTTSDHSAFTGAVGEVTVDTTLKTIRVHDGSTVGGSIIATANGANLTSTTLTSPSIANAAISGANNQLSGTLTVTTGSIANGTFTNYTETAYSNAGIGSAFTANLSLGTVQVLTLNNNCTFTMPTAAAGKSFVTILNSGSGGYSVTWSTVAWPSATAPTLTATASKKDIFSFFSDGTNWYGATIGQNY